METPSKKARETCSSMSSCLSKGGERWVEGEEEQLCLEREEGSGAGEEQEK